LVIIRPELSTIMARRRPATNTQPLYADRCINIYKAQRFFERFAALLPGPVSPETMTAVSHANWLEFVGPPAAASDPL
jgi:hypothetical protein